ncbi:unnamed protein product [Schistosoma turkestanicum]|nr:unnamed protein product [Schistosoma turkestanicum]
MYFSAENPILIKLRNLCFSINVMLQNTTMNKDDGNEQNNIENTFIQTQSEKIDDNPFSSPSPRNGSISFQIRIQHFTSSA